MVMIDYLRSHLFRHIETCWHVSVCTDSNECAVEMKSDLSSDLHKVMPNAEYLQRRLQQLIDDILDQRVEKTDMKLRHIVTKGIEVLTYFQYVETGYWFIHVLRLLLYQ